MDQAKLSTQDLQEKVKDWVDQRNATPPSLPTPPCPNTEERVERHQIYTDQVSAAVRKRAFKLAKQIEEKAHYKLHPIIVLVLARFLKAQMEVKHKRITDESRYALEEKPQDHDLLTLPEPELAESDFEYLDLDDIKQACGLPKEVVENLRDAGILEQMRAYKTLRSGAFESDSQLVPVFRLVDPIANLIKPKLHLLGF